MGAGETWLEHLARLSCSELLSEMRVGSDNVYLLGALNRHVTIYSQQIRALNLIEALAQQRGGSLAGAHIAVIGAGFSGLTAAAYAAERYLAEVVVIEQALRPLWIQDQSTKRWLHPRIYDWPNPGALEPQTDLPVLNWRAGPADVVAEKVRRQWDALVSHNERLAEHYGWRMLGWQVVDSKIELRLDWSIPDAAPPKSPASAALFDHLVLAVGFGLEEPRLGPPGSCPSYWNDTDGLDEVRPGESVVIAGLGDGALTDVLRLCIKDFAQGRLVQLLEGLDVAQFAKLREWERTFHANHARLGENYASRDVLSPLLVERLKLQRQSDFTVHLVGRGSPYAPTSAILNRFLLRHLEELGAFQRVEGDVVAVRELGDGRVNVTYQPTGAQKKELSADRCLLRFGPSERWSGFVSESDCKLLEARRSHWRKTPQDMDQTRVPIAPLTTHQSSSAPALASLPVRESGTDPWLLIVHPPGRASNWQDLSHDITEQLMNLDGWSKSTTDALVLASEHALLLDHYATAVRALCSAPVALFDVESLDPGVMLLLGVRAAVRRGVTLICNNQEDGTTWADLPFNIKELNPLASDHPTFVQMIARACSDGAKFQRERPHYLDLPAFDGIRELGTCPSDYEEIPQTREALLLRPFNKAYTKQNLKFVADTLAARLPGTRVKSIIDEHSPRLAGQRLYEAIRRTRLCVIDLTGWRANVLFEAGIRLACSPVRPLFLREIPAAPGADAHASCDAIEKLLGVTRYRVPGATTKIDEALADWAKNDRERTTFPTSSRYFEFDLEPAMRPLSRRLAEAAGLTLRTDAPKEKVDPTLLFASGNSQLTEALRLAGLQNLAAAWIYLDAWEAPSAQEAVSLLDPRFRRIFREYRRLTHDLNQQLEKVRSSQAARLRAMIAARQSEPQFIALRAVDDHLMSWSSGRDYVTKLRGGPIAPGDISAVIEDLEGFAEQYRSAATALKRIGDVSVVLPLQSLVLDELTISRLLKQFHRTP